MGKLILLNILLVIYTSTYVVIASPEEDAACCPADQTFILSASCLDPVTNTKTPISLLHNKTATLVANEDINFTVNDAGQLFIELKNRDSVEYPPGSFCMASHKDKNNSTVTKRYAIVSYKADPDDKIMDDSVRGYCMSVSALFLLVTAVVFTCRPEHRTEQGRSVINFCLSLGFGFGILAVMILLPYTDMMLCAIRGFLVYFFLVASFFWMNVISLQILGSTRYISGAVGNSNKTPFVWYTLYAWGFPIIFTTIMAIINFVPGDHLKPGIGLNTCWFFDKTQQWIYMYSVMSTLIAVNIGIFSYVSTLLWSSSFSSHRRSFKSKVIMTMQLFVVTGVPWIHEIISSLAPHCAVWEVLDILNCLQGVFIFFVMIVFPLLLSEDEDKHYNLNITINQPYAKLDGRMSDIRRQKEMER